MAMTYPPSLQRLIGYLSRLPGIGKRSAERLALSLIGWDPQNLQGFAQAIGTIHDMIHPCSICGNLCENDICDICQDEGRLKGIICVVEQPTQIMAFENAGSFRGLYHVLGGKLSPLNGKGPDDLRIAELHRRIEDGNVSELIIATSSDVEGEATAHYLANEFASPSLSVTRLAAGLPVGADLSFADAATLSIAIDARRAIR